MAKPKMLSNAQRADERVARTIAAVAAETNKEYGAGTVVCASDMLAPARRLSTGSLWFDLALGGGWPQNAWSEIVGYECLAPGTRILTADLSWIDIAKLHVGDAIVGFDENMNGMGQGRTSRYQRAVVTHLGRKILPCYEITTDYGITTVASAGHGWLVSKSALRNASEGKRTQRHWLRTDQLKVGFRIACLGEPWEKDESREAGWLAGFYDGEGCVGSDGSKPGRVAINQVVGPTLDLLVSTLKEKDFNFHVSTPRRSRAHWQDQQSVQFAGRYEDMRFLGSIRPQRLLPKAHRVWEGTSTKQVHGSSALITKIRYVGTREVVTIETSTKTLVADGLLSHNSSGKTAVAYNTIGAAMQRDPNFTALWCAAESFDADYARSFGIDLARLWVLDENTMEIVYEKCNEYVEQRAVDMAVIDAYPSLVTDSEDVAFIGDAQVSPGARLTGKFMRKATKATKRSMVDASDRPFTGLFINQWRSKVGVVFGDTRTTPGGVGKNFWFASRVELTRDAWLKNDDDFVVGQRIKMNVFKNKSARPRREGLCDFYFHEYDGHTLGDFDFAGEVWELGKGLEVLERRGNSYFFNNQVIAKTQRDTERTIRADRALCLEIASAIWLKELGVEATHLAPRAPRFRGRPRGGLRPVVENSA